MPGHYSDMAIQNLNTGFDTSGLSGGGFDGVGALSMGGGNPQSSGGPSFFQKGGGAGLALGAVQTLASLWSSFQQNQLASKSLALQTRAFDTNLKNQTKTYNTALEDRISSRYVTEGKSQGDAQTYIDKHKL